MLFPLLIISAFLLVLLSLGHVQFAHGIQSASMVTSWSNFTDKDNRFSLTYPSGDQLKERTNRFQIFDVVFYHEIPRFTFSVVLDRSSWNVTDINSEFHDILDDIDASARKKNSEIVVMETNDTKYKIDGNNATSRIVYLKSYDGQEGGLLAVVSQKDGYFILVNFVSSPDDFEKALPIAERMIESINILK